MSRSKFTLGQRVRFSDTIRRVGSFSREKGEGEYLKTWTRKGDWYHGSQPNPGEGILVGLRTFQDGALPPPRERSEEWEAFGGWQRTGSRSVAIIATALHLKPVYAFLEDVEPVEPEAQP